MTVAKLSDGRVIRVFAGEYTQEEMFGLHKSGLFDPKTETIMSVRELDDALNVSGAWKAVGVDGCWRTREYGVHATGFEKELDKPVGASVVYITIGEDVPYTFEVPDVKHPQDKDKGLRQATGMLVFALDKLDYDEGKRILSVVSNFNPETDVRVKDIMRPAGWALVDADGYPIRTRPSNGDTNEARYSAVRDSDALEGCTGWHGSVVRSVYRRDDDIRRLISTDDDWEGLGVALVPRVADSESPVLDSEAIALRINNLLAMMPGAARTLDTEVLRSDISYLYGVALRNVDASLEDLSKLVPPEKLDAIRLVIGLLKHPHLIAAAIEEFHNAGHSTPGD